MAAKKTSKNDIAKRAGTVDILYGGQAVKPILYHGDSGSFMAAQYKKDGSLVRSGEGEVMPFTDIVNGAASDYEATLA